MVTYIFAHRKIYESFSFEQLVKMFELSKEICLMTVTKLIEVELLSATISADNIKIHASTSTKFEFLC